MLTQLNCHENVMIEILINEIDDSRSIIGEPRTDICIQITPLNQSIQI